MARFVVVGTLLAFLISAAPAAPARAANAADCPNGGVVRFGVEPFEAAARLVPAYNALAKLIGEKLGCTIELSIPTSYNAEIEAMRAGKLEAGEFGPLGYVLARQVAHADVIATYSDAKGAPSTYFASIVTSPSTGIKSLKEIANRSFAYSDPASTSGHLFPAFALSKAGIDPDKGVKPFYAGSHTASFEALRNHKVDAGELNSALIDAATTSGDYKPADFVTLWKSQPIPNDAIAVRRDLPEGFKKRFASVLMSIPFSQLPPDVVKVFPAKGTTSFVPMPDSAYDVIRDLVSTLHIDLNKLS
ncbi:MAG TPA: phosphate/phosphite/phosphonate ABC transporter substrate-binding protein [Candidatus Elarobacter sp.]